jgi:hypothetical protein
MLLPGFGRAVGGLGVNGARIIARTDAQKLIRSMIADGKTAKEIAASVNERFAPLLDEGASVTHQQIANGKYRGTFDVGAMGGQGASPRITSDQVEQMMRDLEYENVRTVPPKKGDSLYVYGDPPGNPPRSPADTPVVRVTADGHLGRPLSGREVGNRFDTGTPDPTRRKIDERAYQNQAGDPYADPQALEGALRWRRGDLVSPDMAPRGTRELPPLEQPTPSPQEGPIHDPRQLKLLSRGLPPGFVLDSDNAMAQ